MVQTPNNYTLKGRLQIVLDGTGTVPELGEVEVPIRVDFRPPPAHPGPTYRRTADDPTDQREAAASVRCRGGATFGDHGPQRDGV